MSLRARVLLGYGLVLLLVAAVLAVALVRLRGLSAASELILRDNVRSVLYADRMIDALERMDSAVLLQIAGDGPMATAQFDSARAAFERHLADERANLTVPGEAAAAAGVGRNFARYLRLVGAPGAPPPSLARYRRALLPAFFRVRRGAAYVRELNLGAMRAASDRAQRTGRAAFWVTLGMGALALGSGFAAALVLSSSLARPLRRATAAAERIGRGDLDVRLEEDAPGELAELARTMNGMAQQLRDVRAINVQQLVAEKRKADAVLQALGDGVLVVDEALRVAAYNPAAERALGAQRPGLPLDEAIRDAALAHAVRQGLRTGGGSVAAPALLFVTGPGEDARHYQAVVSTLAGPFGGTAAVVLLRDLTEVRVVERMKSNFIMLASHELRTPLTGLEMSLGMLAHAALRDADRELVDVAVEEAARLSRLVADLLELASAEAGETRLSLGRYSPAALVEDVRARFAAQAEAAGVALGVDAPAPLRDVEADAERVGLALSNLVANALRHARGAIVLRATADADAVTFAVDDDGPGVPASERERLFEPFFQLAEGSPGGAGVGLTLVREIAELHGGRAGVGAARGGGASFWFTVPTLPG